MLYSIVVVSVELSESTANYASVYDPIKATCSGPYWLGALWTPIGAN